MAPAFRRVEPPSAGPAALGILVPPGTPTLVVVRPRSLGWDLLPARWEGDAAVPPCFCRFGRDEAAQLARRMVTALEEAVVRNVNPVGTFGDARGRSFQVWVRAADLFWIVCRRTSGGAYQPLVMANLDEARRVGEELSRVVWPHGDVPQEYYFNTQKFM